MFFKPYPGLTFFFIIVFFILFIMGTWQLQKYKYKKKISLQVNSFTNISPKLLNNLYIESNFKKFEYYPIKLKGEYLIDKQILVRGQYKKNKYIILYGFFVFTPYKYINNKNILIHIMIERGFIPDNFIKKPKLYKKIPIGQTIIKGSIRISEKIKFFTPINNINKEIWYWKDIISMGKKFKLNNVQKFYISLNENTQQNFPVIITNKIKKRNNHLEYSIVWYALLIELLILYIYIHIQNDRLYLLKNKFKNNNKIDK